MIKVLLDDGLTGYGKVSGIGHHMVHLSRHLKEITECEITQYELLRKIPRYFRKWSYIGACNIPSLYNGYDIVHHLANYVPMIRGRNKRILTVYDLSVFHYPETISIAWRHYNALSLRKSIERADAIITISKAVQHEVLDAFPHLDNNRVFVSYPGIRNPILNSEPNEKDIINLGVKPFSYFLFIGEMTKRKNLAFALSSYGEAKKKKLIDDKTEFVIVGKKSWGYSEIKPEIEQNPSVKTLGYLSDDQIASLYRYAKALVYPSIYEGFGIPIVEAMSIGVPIIISNIPTSKELNEGHNNQMFCFDLGDRDTLIKLLQKLDKEYLEIRSRLDYGSLTEYNYDSIAANHLRIYLEVLNRN